MNDARIYEVFNSAADDGSRLVRAKSRARAIAHVTKPYTARIATQDALIELLAAGVKVEDAEGKA